MQRDAGGRRFRFDHLQHIGGELRRRRWLNRQLLGPREFQEALHDIIEPPNLAGDDVHMFAGGSGTTHARELRLEQLQVNGHRVQGVFDFMRDSCRQAAERRDAPRELEQLRARRACRQTSP